MPRSGCIPIPGADRRCHFTFCKAGKRLVFTAAEVLVILARPTLMVCDEVKPGRSNYLHFRLSPDVYIALGVYTKVAGESMLGGS